ncbi:uncharacterized protein [Ptychodera flava]|uniref:uncharacterized protein n=1 Tax=Ptychodera flava TaxID=63121 RepID=UPI00396A1C85
MSTSNASDREGGHRALFQRPYRYGAARRPGRPVFRMSEHAQIAFPIVIGDYSTGGNDRQGRRRRPENVEAEEEKKRVVPIGLWPRLALAAVGVLVPIACYLISEAVDVPVIVWVFGLLSMYIMILVACIVLPCVMPRNFIRRGMIQREGAIELSSMSSRRTAYPSAPPGESDAESEHTAIEGDLPPPYEDCVTEDYTNSAYVEDEVPNEDDLAIPPPTYEDALRHCRIELAPVESLDTNVQTSALY